MLNNPKVHYIPANPPKRETRVGIYCRVSTNSMEQLQSLTAQVSHLTRLTVAVPQWLLSDVYMDIATSKTDSSRKEFNRMLVEGMPYPQMKMLDMGFWQIGFDLDMSKGIKTAH